MKVLVEAKLIAFVNLTECECNGHATQCEFNQTLYQQSGNGGVCLCLNDTMGINCERCKLGYYWKKRIDVDRYEEAQCQS